MKSLKLEQNSEDWLEWRKGKITGTKLKDIVVLRGNNKKIGFYQLIADRIAIDPDGEDVMDRGHRLEEEAIALFEKQHNLKVTNNIVWISEDNDKIAISPDGIIDDTQAIEIKCLNSASHLQAVIENSIQSDYKFQALQYFIVNEKLQTLWFIFYDPRITAKPYHEIKLNRTELIEDIDKFKQYQIDVLKEVDDWVERLSF